jgi:hypothetical protein
MSTDSLKELILEVERLLSLPAAARESEGIYANESQLKLLRKRIKASRNMQLTGIEKFVVDFSSSNSRLLQIIDALQERD